MQKQLFFILTMVFMQALSAQIPLSYSRNAMRTGDVLYKVKVDYVDAGTRGTNQVWRLGKATEQDKEVIQGIVSKGDTVSVMEKNHIRHFILQGDTLSAKGGQQRRAYRLYEACRPLMRYPFHYGDSVSGNYRGTGREENFNLTVHGWGYTVADGTGILTDGEDTLRHVIRLHMHDEYVEDYDGQTEIRFKCDHYLWFCAGYRYPVMESARYTDAAGMPTDSTTYLFLPVRQYVLGEDAANDSVLAQLDMAGALAKEQGNTISTLSSIQAEVSTDGAKLTVNYSLSADSDVSFVACDIIGNILGASQRVNKTSGDWQETIALSRKPIGNVLVLNVRCGEEKISMKVFIE